MRSNSPLVRETRFCRIVDLKPHENVDPERVASLKAQIEADGKLKLAIAVDALTRVVLDGHHRLAVLQLMGCTRVPVTFVDYSSRLIEISSWNGVQLSKREIIQAGLSGELYPPKSSKHVVLRHSAAQHISTIEKRVNVPLHLLRGKET